VFTDVPTLSRNVFTPIRENEHDNCIIALFYRVHNAVLREQDLGMVHFMNNITLTTHKKDLFVRGVLYEDVAAFVYLSDVSREGIRPVLHIVC
jgi:hypothetical protein